MSRMKATTRFVCSSMLLVLLLCAVAVSASQGGEEQVLVTVNGEKITLSDYHRFLLKVDPFLVSGAVDQRLLRREVEEKLILQEAARKGISVSDQEVEKSLKQFLQEHHLSDAEFEKKIGGRGVTLSEYKKWLKEDTLVRAKMIELEMKAGNTAVGEQEERAYYERNRDRYRLWQGTVQLKAIVLRFHGRPSAAEATQMELKAVKIADELSQEASFEKLVSLYSEDPAKKPDGTFGEFRDGELVPAVEKATLRLKEGGVSNPLWLNEGLYIFKVAKREGERFAPLEDVRAAIKGTILQKRQGERYSAWVGSLWERSNIIFIAQ